MAYGFGEVMGEVRNAAGKIVGGTYDSSKEALGGFFNSASQSMRASQDKIENPHKYRSNIRNVTDDYGNSQAVDMRRGFTDDYGNVQGMGKSNSWIERKANLGIHETKKGLKNWGIGAAMSGGLYGLMAYATDNADNDASDRGVNAAKYAVAAGVDVAADGVLTGVAAGLATFGGPAGIVAGGAITAFNMLAGFAGLDAGSLAMRAMDYTEAEYENAKTGPKFNMTQNTAMSLQRQLGNIAQSGSNLGEMMHN